MAMRISLGHVDDYDDSAVARPASGQAKNVVRLSEKYVYRTRPWA